MQVYFCFDLCTVGIFGYRDSQHAGARCGRCWRTPSLDIPIVGLWFVPALSLSMACILLCMMSTLLIRGILDDDAHYDCGERVG